MITGFFPLRDATIQPSAHQFESSRHVTLEQSTTVRDQLYPDNIGVRFVHQVSRNLPVSNRPSSCHRSVGVPEPAGIGPNPSVGEPILNDGVVPNLALHSDCARSHKGERGAQEPTSVFPRR